MKARRDLQHQLAHIAADNMDAAFATGMRIKASVGRLAEFPDMGRPGRVAGSRELAISGTPFVVAYRVSKDTVAIARLLHGAQRWPKII